MNDFEKYEFDRLGYLVIKDMLKPEEAKGLKEAVDELEEHALANLSKPPRKDSPWGWGQYHANPDRGYHVSGENARGKSLLIEDFWNASSAFDFLINHTKTMSYINA